MTTTRAARKLFAYLGNIEELNNNDREALQSRRGRRAQSATGQGVADATRALIAEVEARGDAALREMAARFDGVALTSLEVPRNLWDAAVNSLSPELHRALQHAAANIADVHTAMLPQAVECSPEPGVVIGRRPDPLTRVGVYAPGGRAAYPSSVLMGVVPARVAGVREIVVCSPPGPDGLPDPTVLAAAAIAHADRVFAVGGAGAIAAMAIGTESIPRVDRIVGPGNAYVAAAKLQLVDRVAIDSPAGPSELLMIVDESADATFVAAELIAQAEHDVDAAVIAIVVGQQTETFAASVVQAVAAQLEASPRAAIVREALATRGAILQATNVNDAITFANTWAPEHLLVRTAGESTALLDELRNAGTVFLGSGSSVAFGDYISGANHVLPTAGLARCYSGLSTLDFFRWTTWQRIDRDAATRLSTDTIILATAERLPGHAAAAMLSARLGEVV